MAKSFNNISLVGRVGTDPETREFNSGTQKSTIRMAVSRGGKGGEEKTDWFSLVFWGKASELCDAYIRKGDLLMVSGRMESSQWTTNDGQKRESWEVNCHQFVMMDQKSREDSSGGGYGGGGKPQRSSGYGGRSGHSDGGTGGGYESGPGRYGSNKDSGWGDDDIPF